MKKNYFFGLLLIMGLSVHAQIVNIPDVNFKNALINTNCVTDGSSQFTTDVDTNDDGEIQESEALAVTWLNVSDQNIADLTGIEAFANLELLYCQNNALTTLNLNNFINLRYLYCSNNSITNLSLTNCFNLYQFFCSYNPMTSIDLSSTKAYRLYITNNPNLTYLNLKNGFMTDGYYSFKTLALPPPPPSQISDNPNLNLVCCDDFEVYYITNHGNFGGPIGDTVNVNSYCTSTPGGSFNTINGNIAFDCDGINEGIGYRKVTYTNGFQNSYVYTNYGGGYSFYTGPNTLTVTPQLPHPDYFVMTPANYNFNFTGSGTTETANFCLVPNGNHPDLEITVTPLNSARPGFSTHYMITIVNKGNQSQSGIVTFTYDGAVLDYVASFPSANAWTTNTVSWDFNNLVPYERKNMELVLNLNSPQEVPPLNLGDILNFQAMINSSLTDETPNDNVFAFNQTVVNSMDPNDKEVVEGSQISTDKIGDYLHYVVRFQNMGTAPAENIVIKDMLDANLDWSTLEMVSSSHPFRSTLTSGNKLEVFYEGINLPDATTDEAASHGYIAYKIKPKSTLVVNDVISNTANIYFDFNFPIVTNTVTTTVTALGTPGLAPNSLFVLYPNPTSNNLNIAVSNNVNVKAITVTNLLGQVMMKFTPASVIDVAALAKGTYLITVETDKGKETRKFSKL
ncbi:DUF7619 domain-containing protein [Flavobacterium sp. XGLA_31]|uniref:T9SS type A sorting domain-containing protein n=1 Tax=Flavobacterium sp. XGLA_31 TaxID=3447666 RepID=UPI003F36E3CF